MRTAMLLFTLATAGCGTTPDASSPVVDAASLATTRLRVEGMTCASCEVSIRVAAEKLDGVASASVDYATGTAEVRYDPARLTPNRIAEAISTLGYPATVASDPAATTSEG